MAIIEVEINSKIYQIGCETEDEQKIRDYVSLLNDRIEEFKSQDPVFFLGLNDERVFLFNVLMLIAENIELKNILQDKICEKEQKNNSKEPNFEINQNKINQFLTEDSINQNEKLTSDLDIIYNKIVTINDSFDKMKSFK